MRLCAPCAPRARSTGAKDALCVRSHLASSARVVLRARERLQERVSVSLREVRMGARWRAGRRRDEPAPQQTRPWSFDLARLPGEIEPKRFGLVGVELTAALEVDLQELLTRALLASYESTTSRS